MKSAMILVFLLLVPGIADGQDSDLSVMSFNIRYGTANDGADSWEHRSDFVIDVIRDAAPHVLGVQEALAFQVRELESALPGYRRVGVGRDDADDEGEFAAIYFDSNRFELLESGHFWFSDTPTVPGSMHWGNRITRMCTWVRLHDLETHALFYVYNLHWDHQSQESRERSAGLLLSRIEARSGQDEPVIVTGDFNAGEDNPAFTHLTAGGLSDTYRLRHPETTQVGTFNSFRGDSDGDKIDAILVSSGWVVADAEILRMNRNGRYPSDHYPVVARLSPAPR